MSTQIDANAVISRLSSKLSEANVTIAILESQVEQLQQELSNAPGKFSEDIEVVQGDTEK